VSIKYV